MEKTIPAPADAARPTLPIRGYLLHITHYDPVWNAKKDQEEPFNLSVGLQVIEAMAKAGLNLLIIDPKDGVKYASHPELTRHYSQDISILRELGRAAASHGIEIAYKLNFSQSALHQHNHWFRPHNNLFDSPDYWRLAFEVIDELLGTVRPARFFHVGMDEDHWRSYRQYVEAIKTLRAGLETRGLRTLIWNDSACQWPAAEIHKEKSLVAERELPRDVIQVLWDYGNWDPEAFARIRNEGFDVWGAPGDDPQQIKDMRDRLLKVGGSGMVLTRWTPCTPANREKLLDRIRLCGPLC